MMPSLVSEAQVIQCQFHKENNCHIPLTAEFLPKALWCMGKLPLRCRCEV